MLEKGPSAYGHFLIRFLNSWYQFQNLVNVLFSDLESITVVDDNITEGYTEEVASFLLGEVCLDYHCLIP